MDQVLDNIRMGDNVVWRVSDLKATPNEGYTFVNWTENGTVVSSNASYTFQVTAGRELVANFQVSIVPQSVTLTQGWNWWSTNLDITLDDLKAALTAALPGATSITIKSKTKTTSYNGSYWRGTLTNFDVAQMYEIQTPAACTITVTGTPVDPAEHPVTITANGNAWIGFPFSESKSLNEAFGSFPVNGDIIKAKNGNASYNGSFWRGTFSTLEPGQGYIYKSASGETRTLTF